MGQGGDGDSQICPTMRLEIRSSEFTSASSLAATATTIVCSRRLGGGGAGSRRPVSVASGPARRADDWSTGEMKGDGS
nr:hypothetical protein Itr_chr02CG11450 [Ipomoea trifida]